MKCYIIFKQQANQLFFFKIKLDTFLKSYFIWKKTQQANLIL